MDERPAPRPATPPKELEEFERVQASAFALRGGPRLGDSCFLVSCKFMLEWRQWVGHPSVQRQELRRTLSDDAPPQSPPRLCRFGSDPVIDARAPAKGWTKERPGPIDNHILLENGSAERLRRGLFEQVDFELVAPAAWNLLHSWYSGGPAIERSAVQLSSGAVQFELYHLRLKACRSSDYGAKVSLDMSKAATVDALKGRLCKEFGLQTRCTRLWSSTANEQQLRSLEGNDCKTLEACQIPESHLLILEEQTADGRWTLQEPQQESVSRDMKPLGLKNLTNTCYLNSSVQCLAHVPPLRDYFLDGQFQEALVTGGHATEKTTGQLAQAFAELLNALWRGHNKVVNPCKLKEIVGKFDDRFSGFQQHDSMEFIDFVLDSLKEDCNMVKGKKPYVERPDDGGRDDHELSLEAANHFLLRNDSRIDDWFVGFLKSVIICPEETCRKQSVVFDAILTVAVPIVNVKQSKETPFTVTIVPKASSKRPIHQCSVWVPKYGSIGDLIEVTAREGGVDPDDCALVEILKGKIYKFFEWTDKLEDIAPSDILLLYELADATAFGLTAEQRWGSGEGLREGDVVVTQEALHSSSKKSRYLRKGLHGKVVSIDDENDALISFDGIDVNQWIFNKNFDKLKTDLNMDSDEQRICPDDGKPYTLRRLVESWNDQYSLEDLRSYWRDAMKPCIELENKDSNGGVIVYFRRGSTTCVRGLMGLPMAFSTSRSTSWKQLAHVIADEMRQRFFLENLGDWKLFKADSNADALHSLFLVYESIEDDDIPEELEWLRGREYFVVEWDGDAPQQVSNTFGALCRNSSENEEVTVTKCLEWFTEQEQLSEQDTVYCSSCKEHRRAFKKVDFWSSPPVLVLQLKRFEYTGMSRRRISTPVQFPMEGLDLAPFVLSRKASFPSTTCVRAGQRVQIHGLQSAAGQKLNGMEGTVMYLDTVSARFCVRIREDDPPDQWKKVKPSGLRPVATVKPEDEVPPPVYDLVAVSKHMGAACSGHYVAYARSCEDGIWRLFDDDDVSEVSPQTVEAERVGAYVLFYIRRDLRPARWSYTQGAPTASPASDTPVAAAQLPPD